LTPASGDSIVGEPQEVGKDMRARFVALVLSVIALSSSLADAAEAPTIDRALLQSVTARIAEQVTIQGAAASWLQSSTGPIRDAVRAQFVKAGFVVVSSPTTHADLEIRITAVVQERSTWDGDLTVKTTLSFESDGVVVDEVFVEHGDYTPEEYPSEMAAELIQATLRSPNLREAIEKIGDARAAAVSSAASKPAEAPVAAKPAALIVAVFEVHDGSEGNVDKKTLAQLTTYLSARLSETAGWKIVPRDQLQVRLQDEKTKSFKECFDQTCQIELGKAVAAQKSLATTLLRVGDRCALTATLFDLKSETADRSTTVRTNCKDDDLMDAVDKISEQFGAREPAAK